MKLDSGKLKAFTLVENMIALGLASALCLSFFGAIILAGKMAGWSRDAMQAAEIADAKIESIRTHSWTQIQSMFATPKTFRSTNGIVYVGKITVRKAPNSSPYNDELLEVTVDLSWSADGRPRAVKTQTCISPYGHSSDTL